MNCPTDGTTLLMSERQGIEIDYCPQCRGIWLDRGELDKILDRAKAESEPVAPEAAPQTPAAPAAPAAQPLPPQDYPAQGYAQPAQPRYDDRRDARRDDRRYDDRRDDRGYGDRYYDDRKHDPRYRKKKSPFEFLGDIFD